jgi:hypothetical protein
LCCFTFSSLVKAAASHLKFAVKTGLMATIIPYTSMTRVISQPTGNLALFPHTKQRVMRRAMRLKADKERNIPVQPPTTSREWLKEGTFFKI